MEIDNLQKIWKSQQQLIDQQKRINENILKSSIKQSSMWLAPNKIVVPIFVFCCAICLLVVVEGYYIFLDVLPILLMCIWGLLEMSWQTSLRNKIVNMEGGLIGMESNILKYKINYQRSKKRTWIIFIPYMLWFAWFLNQIGYNIKAIVILIGVTIIMAIIAWKYRNKKTNNALEIIESNIRELEKFKK